MRRIADPALLVAFLSAVSACGNSTGDGVHGSNPDDPGQFDPGTCDADCPGCDTADAADLFDGSTVPVFALTLPDDRWQHLQDHAVDEEYEPACLTFEGDPVGAVGLRFKGSYGTLYPCLEGDIDCPKLSMKIKFNEVDEELRLYTLKRLNFHSMLHDPTKLKERLGYDLYREMGIEAPRSAWAELRINGESFGLFSMVEQIDGRFTHSRWPDDGDGNLFKEAWPQTTSASYYTEHLKTNEEVGDVSKFVEFSQELEAAESQAERASVLGSWTDIERFRRYMAIDDAIFNCDGVTAFYTTEGWKGNHNYYFYQATLEDQFAIIPWDLDSTFTPWATWSMIPRWTEIPEDCEESYPTWDGTDLEALAPGCDPVFQGLADDLDAYRAAIDELLSGPFDEDYLLAKIDELMPHIAAAVAADPLGPGTAGWEGSVAQLRRVIPVLRERLARLRDGETVIPLTLSPTELNDFEDASLLGLLLGTQLYYNASSTVEQSVNSDGALAGTQDVRLDFEYRDEEDAWQQWLNYMLAFEGAPLDVTDVTGVRMTAMTDRPRTLRIDLSSPENSNGSAGVRPGWEVLIGTEPTAIEVRFQDAVVPSWAIDQGIDPGDPLEDVLASVTGLFFHPYCAGRDALGFLGEGASDVGFLQIDDVQLFSE